MQLTMNNDQIPTVSVVNRFISWISAIAKRIASVFVKPEKEKAKFTLSTVSDGIGYIEWRTWYDQQRILNTVSTVSAIKVYPELCVALGIQCPSSHKVSANIVITDSSFDRRLIKFFGFEELNPRTQALLSGDETQTQKQFRTTEFEKMFQRNIRKDSQATDSYETRLLKELVLVLNVIQVAIDESKTEQQPALLALPAAEEVVDVVAETLPVEEVEQPIEVEQPVKTIKKKAEKKTAKKSKIFVKTEKKTKELAHCTIPEMKAFAKRKGFPVPGAITVKSDIQAYITERFNELNNSN